MAKTKELKMGLPPEFINALNRRYLGKKHTQEEINNMKKQLSFHYGLYLNYKKKLDNLLNVFWEKKKVEENYKTPLFYNAHSRLKRYEKVILTQYKTMFRLLTHFDGNYDQEFSQFGCISPEDIMFDFENKYLKTSSKSSNEGR